MYEACDIKCLFLNNERRRAGRESAMLRVRHVAASFSVRRAPADFVRSISISSMPVVFVTQSQQINAAERLAKPTTSSVIVIIQPIEIICHGSVHG